MALDDFFTLPLKKINAGLFYYDFVIRIMHHTSVWFDETGSVLEDDNAQQLI